MVIRDGVDSRMMMTMMIMMMMIHNVCFQPLPLTCDAYFLPSPTLMEENNTRNGELVVVYQPVAKDVVEKSGDDDEVK